MNGRRRFLGGLMAGALIAARSAPALAGKVFRIGGLSPAPAAPAFELVVTSLHKLGYVEGDNLIVERRLVASENLPSAALELARMKVDVILAGGSSSVHAVMAATRKVPVVAVDLETDPVASGYAASLARPGGNLTGFFLDLPEFSAKRLEVLKQALPRITQVTLLWDPSLDRAPLSKMDAAARALNLRLTLAEARTAADLANTFEVAARRKTQALMVMQSPTLDALKKDILMLAARYQLPVFAMFDDFAVDGALLSYGPSRLDLLVRSATYVDKVLRGQAPADLPIQRPVKIDLFVNLKTAKSLGLTIGQSILLRADEVIR